jgi:hypothetical protein
MKIFVTGALLLGLGCAQGQTIWRCGPDGRSFSDRPCSSGQALEALQPRPASDQAEAQRQLQRDQALAKLLRRERLLRESQAPTGLAGINGSRLVLATDAATPSRHPHHPRWQALRQRPGAAETFRAIGPASR